MAWKFIQEAETRTLDSHAAQQRQRILSEMSKPQLRYDAELSPARNTVGVEEQMGEPQAAISVKS